MRPKDAQIHAFLRAFGLSGDLYPLPGEHDLNYRLTGPQGRHLVKLHAPGGDPGLLDMQIAVLDHLTRVAPDLPVSRPLRAEGAALVDCAGYQGRVLSWLEGEVWAKARPGPSGFAGLGRLLGRLDRALEGFAHPSARRAYGWDIGQALDHRPSLPDIAPDKRATVAAVFDAFEALLPALAACPRQVIHNDANDYNVLLQDGAVSGLLDFGDMVESWRVVELAVAAAYALIGTPDPVGAILPLVAAYHAENPLTEGEIATVFPLIRLRYAVSITMAAVQIKAHPDNTYLLISQQDVWRELQRLMAEDAALAHLRLREACGLPPLPATRPLMRWLEREAHRFHPVLHAGDRRFLPRGSAAPGDAIGVAPHGETRGDGDFHLGIDLFAPAGEPVHAPLPGLVRALGSEDGDSLLLEHEAEGLTFWTLYRHLDPASLPAPGQAVAAGQALARIGPGPDPHLHLQLVVDHLGLGAELPGMGRVRDASAWTAASPDPSVLIGLPIPASVTVPRPVDWLVAQRARRLGRSLSIAYAPEALKIVGGDGCHLIDDQGRRWLDMVNNVAHCGHNHPRIVAAAQTQIARLNTNARYLHDTLVAYADRLVGLFPPPLSVCFFVNSGSEANDLAIRLARAATGNHDLITVDHAYHGHLTSLIDVSPYKFAGPGGAGRPAHVRVAEMPDPYRGRFRSDDPQAGGLYAQSVADQVADLAAEGRRPALFLSEGILGTGGQIVPPPGYLAQAYAHVRAAGGLCLADEVQVGFGRVGRAMWAFETQGAVPDIVTLGKPIGNGHPMAAVITTPAIADAFANGMEYFNTFGGNPVSAAIGLTVLDVIRDERLMAHCAAMGDRLTAGARALADRFPAIGEVRGLGLFLGIDLVIDRDSRAPDQPLADAVVARMRRKHGILLSTEGPGHNVLKIKPPAAITAADVDHFLAALGECLGAGAA